MQERSRNIFTADRESVESSCFIDTGVFFAASNTRDLLHKEAVLLLVSAVLGWFGRQYTSTYVFDETVTLAKTRIGGKQALNLAENILQSKKISILKIEERADILEDALSKFRKHSDMRGLSFTDCTTLALLERLKTKYVLSFDRNFRSFVPVLLGERYSESLTREEFELLLNVMKKLQVKL